MCAFQTDLSILKDYDTDFFQARSSEKRTLIERTEVWEFFPCTVDFVFDEKILQGFSPCTGDFVFERKIPMGISHCTGDFEFKRKNPYREFTKSL